MDHGRRFAGFDSGLTALTDQFVTAYSKSMENDLSTRIRWHEVVTPTEGAPVVCTVAEVAFAISTCRGKSPVS